MPNVFEQGLPACPNCGETPNQIIQEIGKPTKYVHFPNNQSPVVHEDPNTGAYDG